MTEKFAEESLASSLPFIFDNLMANCHTATIGRVTKFDRTANTVSVQPVLKRKLRGSDETLALPVIEDVPVVFPWYGDLGIVCDIAVDSYVLLVFAERSISNWIDRGGIVDPERSRKFDLSDAIAIPGLNPNPETFVVTANTLAIRDRDNNTKIELTATNITLTNGGGTISLNSSGQMNVNSGNLTVDK